MEPAPAHLGRFSVLARVSSGGTAIVYHAQDVRDGTEVALKVSRGGDAPARRLLLREARLLAELRLPGVVAHHAHGVLPDGRAWLAQQWLPGESLEALLARGPLAIPEALSLAWSLCRALTELHAVGVLHGDLSPANVRVLLDGSVRLVDLGLGGRAEARDQVPGGTLGALAPERLRDSGLRSPTEERFALGCLLFELFTGTPPFKAPGALAWNTRVLLDPAPSARARRKDLPRALEALLRKLLAQDPEARPEPSRVLAVLTALVAASKVGAVAGTTRAPREPSQALAAERLYQRSQGTEADALATSVLARVLAGSRDFYQASEVRVACAARRGDLPAVSAVTREALRAVPTREARRPSLACLTGCALAAAQVGLLGLLDEVLKTVDAWLVRGPRADLAVTARLHRLQALRARLQGDGALARRCALGAVAAARRCRERRELARCRAEQVAGREMVHARTISIEPALTSLDGTMNTDVSGVAPRSFEHEPGPVFLLVDGDRERRAVLREFLTDEGPVCEADTWDAALREAEAHPPAVVLCGPVVPGGTALGLASELALRLGDEPAVVVLVPPSEAPGASHAVREGRIYGHLKEPWQPDELLALVTQAWRYVSQRRALGRMAGHLARLTPSRAGS
jgi:CheY-like chemotaxis protein